MRDVIPAINNWHDAGKDVALATVIKTWGSAPRQVGSHMAISENGEISGSVSGGCVEGAVIEASLGSLKTGQPQLLHFGVTDETAWEVGLACGGDIEVFVQKIDRSSFRLLKEKISSETLTQYSTLIQGDQKPLGTIELLSNEPFSTTPQIIDKGNNKIFVNTILPSPQLVVIGGVQIAIALFAFAKTLNFKTILVDPRKAFGNTDRFPNADLLIQAWPQQAFESIHITQTTAIAALTHDPKLDDPALIIALKSKAFYVGALGSNKTQSKRKGRLLAAGIDQGKLTEIKGPIGLSIGAISPEEIALAIMAEIVAEMHSNLDN